ncbi:MAG: branched-chain amino acid ABC transporter permease [Ferrimicrobium sp.]
MGVELAVALVFGVVTGTLYGLAALGLVLVYRVSRVLNFALVGTATVTAYMASTLIDSHWPYWAVVIAVVVVGALLGGLCHAVLNLARNASANATGVGSIGLFLLLEGSVLVFWGTNDRGLPPVINGATHIGTITVSYSDLLTIAIGFAAILLSFVVVYRTRLGLQMRAVSAGPRTAELLGINRRRTERWAWCLGGALGSLAALLIVPLLELNLSVFVTFMLAAFAAVVLGGFTSLGGVLLGGITMGIALNLLATFVSTTYTSSFTFLLVALVLLLRPQGLFGSVERSVAEPALPPSPVLRRRGMMRARKVHTSEAKS